MHAGRAQVCAGQVDAAGPGVLADVLAVFEDLQRRRTPRRSRPGSLGVAASATCSTSRPTGAADSRQ